MAKETDLLQQLLRVEIDYLLRMPDGSLVTRIPKLPAGILSGSFNPRHIGHNRMMRHTARLLDGDVLFELSIRNAEKTSLSMEQVLDRCEQFPDTPVVLSNSPTFVEKSRSLPGMNWIVGVDTAERILNHRFYSDCQHAMLRALEEIDSHRGRFFVACRMIDGTLKTLGDLTIPPKCQHLFQEIPPEDFREDISSTLLRNERSNCLP